MVSLLAVSVIVLSGTVRAQRLSLDTTFQAPLFTLSVQAARVVALSNGQALVFSGYQDPFVGFDRFNGVATGNLVRLNTDGSVDTSFVLDPALRAKSIASVAPMANGQYIVSTLFVSNSGSYGQVYRLNADGSVDTTFNPAPEEANNVLFRAVAVQRDGKVLAGCVSAGFIGTGGLQYEGVVFTGLLRLNADGSIDTGFNVTLGNDGTVALPGIAADGGIQLQTDGKIVIAGGFSSINGTTQANVARLNTDGSLDTSFVPSGFSVTYGNSGFQRIQPTRAAAIQPDGKIVVAGEFNRTFPGSTSQALVRLNTDGSRDTTFNAATGSIREGFLVRLQPDGKVLLSDIVVGFLRYNSDGSLDTAFNTSSGGVGFANGIGVLPNGQVLVAGDVNAAGLLRLNADGTPDIIFNPSVQADAAPFHVALLHNGTVLAAGDFDTVAGQKRAGLALLNANGSLKAANLPSPFLVDDFDAPDFVVQSDDNKILLFGNTPADADGNTGFTYLRLNANLSVDTTLTADASVAPFQTVLYQPGSGYLLSAGSPDVDYISASGGLPGDPAFFLHRLGLQGSPDPDFVPGIDTTTIFNGQGPGNLANATLYSGSDSALAVQPDGKILYKYFDNTEAYRLVRLNADGSRDGSFRIGSAPPTSPAFTGFTNSVDIGAGSEQAMSVGAASAGISGAFVQSNGRILIYGDFATYNGQTANGLARLKANGKLDTKFNTGAGPQGPGGAVGSAYAVTSAQELSNGQVLIVGSFTSFNGFAQPGIVRLNANGSVDTTFTASGIISQQAGIGPSGLGNGSSSLASTNNGTYLLTGNYTATNGAGAGSFFRLFGGVSTTPTPVKPVVPKPLP